jgi:dihydroflavonol-4-reductase
MGKDKAESVIRNRPAVVTPTQGMENHMTKRTVLLTGATGYIAKHVALRLLDAGHDLRASVRDMARADEVRSALRPHLADPAALDRLQFVTLDLGQDAGWDVALMGVDALVHTASPFPLVQPRDEADLIRPAVEGTLRALRAATAAGVGRVVLTSSSAAVMGADPKPGHGPFDEDDWTDPTHPDVNPYSRSKTLAERAAWDFVRDHAPDIALTTINPVLVLGPSLDRHFGTSVSLVERVLRARDPAVPRVGFPIVDVRDVAEMHLRALERPETAGQRFIGANGFLWFMDVAQIIKAAHPDRRIVTRRAPDALLRVLAIFDKSIRTVLPMLGRRDDVSSARAQRIMGMQFIPSDQSVRETARFLIDNGIVR